ncbi:BTB/POZ domain-containing protein KCTD4 isoform X2 [Mobula hypostoma]|uniref:BTB/POZ domain-containing protein KCTD4 isoform X2 n=1 Tax=Mobula hypostoma TaxID=723540 RepID=UPI002FC35E3A
MHKDQPVMYQWRRQQKEKAEELLVYSRALASHSHFNYKPLSAVKEMTSASKSSCRPLHSPKRYNTEQALPAQRAAPPSNPSF